MRRKQPKSVWWFEPRWAFVPEFYAAFRMSRRPVLRGVVASGILSVTIAVVLEAQVPILQVNWLGVFASLAAAIIGLGALFTAMYLMIPPVITVQKRGVTRTQGQATSAVRVKDISSIHLVFRDGPQISMWVTTDKRCRRFAVSQNVDLDRLAAIVGEKLCVLDQRAGSVQ